MVVRVEDEACDFVGFVARCEQAGVEFKFAEQLLRPAAVNDVEVEGGKIRYRDDHDHDTSLTITLSAPAVSSFEMAGSGDLNIKAHFVAV